MDTKTLNIEKQFKRVLATKGLLNPCSGVGLVFRKGSESALLAKWQKIAKSFIYKGQKISVRMDSEQCLAMDAIWVWPVCELEG